MSEFQIENVIAKIQFFKRIIKQGCVVRLEAEPSLLFQNLFEHFKKARTGKPSLDVALAWARVRKRKPYFICFTFLKETFDVQYLSPEKPNVSQPLFKSPGASLPKAVALHINAHKI